MADGFARGMVKLRWVGLVVLLATLAVGIGLAPGTVAALEPGGFEVRHSRVARVEASLAERFGTTQVDLVLLVEDLDGQALAQPGEGSEESGRLVALRRRLTGFVDPVGSVEVAQILGPAELASTLGREPSEAVLLVALTGDERDKQRALADLVAATEEAPGLDVAVGGPLAADVEAQALSHADLRRAERVALPIALLLLLLYFRRPIPALLPALVGGFAITGSFPILRGLAELTPVSLFALNIVVFLGLGLAIDYSLFLVQRQREELAVGNPVEVALARTLQTAGKTVLFSGVAVIVSLLALAWVPISLLRSVALGGALVVVLANVGALVILPCLLALLGRRVAGRGLLGDGPPDPRLLRAVYGAKAAVVRHDHATDSGMTDLDALTRPPASMWARVAAAVMRRPAWVALAVGVLLLLAGAPTLRMQTATADARIFPPASEVHRVHAAASDPARFPVDPTATHLLRVSTRGGGPIVSASALASVEQLAEQAAAIDGVTAVVGLPSLPLRQPLGAPGSGAPTLAELLASSAGGPLPWALPDALRAELARVIDADATLVRVSSAVPASSPAAREQLAAIRAAVPPGLEVAIAGPAARAEELDQALAGGLIPAATTVAVASFVVLVLAFGAPVVALKAVLMNALSLTASFGALVWVFQDGRFEALLDYRSFATIEPTVPVMMFALVFGLSMDYELFLLSRIREAWLRRTGEDRQDPNADLDSVEEGLTRTGPIITTAAAILIVVVLGLAAGTLVFMKQLGLGMALAILLDATLIRLLLVPSTMALLGHRNWWTPRWLGWLRAKLRLELREDEAVLVG